MRTPLLNLQDLSDLADQQDHNSAHDSVADLRWWKVSDARQRIASGHYDEDYALDQALDRLLNELRTGAC